jgi:hypothetical protein
VQPFLVSFLFLVMGFLFLFVAATGAYGLFRMLREHTEHKRYLTSGSEDAQPVLDHLSPQLRGLVIDARLLRIALEAPLVRVDELIGSPVSRALRERSGRPRASYHASDAQDLEEFDLMLLDVSRQLADWVAVVDRLPEADRLRLVDAGLDPEHVRKALVAEGGAFERGNLRPAGRPAMDERLARIVDELGRVEHALQLGPRGYR